MNHCVFQGRLTADPTYKTGKSTKKNGSNEARDYSLAKFALAVNDKSKKRSGGEEKSANFIPCTVWGYDADFINTYCRKGTKILITGELITDYFTDENGQKVYTWNIKVESIDDIDWNTVPEELRGVKMGNKTQNNSNVSNNTPSNTSNKSKQKSTAPKKETSANQQQQNNNAEGDLPDGFGGFGGFDEELPFS